MPIKWLLAAIIASPSAIASSTQNSLDTQSIDWLISQVQLGEIELDTELMTNSLDKLLSIAPKDTQVQCAEIRVLYALKETEQANNFFDDESDLNWIRNIRSSPTPSESLS